MKCVICDKEVVSSRSDAKFCSASCRKKASRNVGKVDLDSLKSIQDVSSEYHSLNQEVLLTTPQDTAIPQEEVEVKKCQRSPKCCSECLDLSMGHWCPSKNCGCFQTREEQEKDIAELQANCPHLDKHMARCAECTVFVQQVKRDGTKNFLKKPKKD